MIIRLPLTVLGYSPKKMFAFQLDDNGKSISAIPVFTIPAKAERYRRHWQRQDVNLRVLLLDRADNAVNLFEVVSVIDPEITHVALDPSTLKDEYNCIPILDFIIQLKDDLLGRPDLTRKADTSHRPQTNQDED